MSSERYILGIDTSCDDTSMAIFDVVEQKMLSNVVSSQIEIHSQFGGIVPEVASRAHAENLALVFEECLKTAGLKHVDIDRIAVTKTPGLMGCLLVGTSFAKGLGYQLQLPLSGVNHLEAHLFSPFIGRDVKYPFMGLVVSGGHTSFYYVTGPDEIKVIGQTVDDAAGEAFDKCAKMLGLGYPGGPVVDRLAKEGDNSKYAFTIAKVKMGKQYMSFSGLKTAARHHIIKNDFSNDAALKDFCASLQKGIVDSIIDKMDYLMGEYPCEAFALSGGVAMNSELRDRVRAHLKKRGKECFIAAPEFCTDNGAMVAFRAWLEPGENELFTLATMATKKIQARGLKNEKIHTTKN